MNFDCILCGVGGQGTVLAAKVIADAAIQKGEMVKTSETIGMAQKGGSVVSHIRFGNDIHSPLVPKGSAKLMLAFEPAEAVRNFEYLDKNATIIVSETPVKPTTAMLSNFNYDGIEMIKYLKDSGRKVVTVNSNKVAEKCGTVKALNVVLLGIMIGSNTLPLNPKDIEKSLFNRLPSKVHDINKKALKLGIDIGKEVED